MRPLTLVLLFCVTSGALAQAPRVTPAGDPSVRNDTLYSLVVSPEDHRDRDFVYLLDDGIVRIERDGRGSRTYRQIVQVFNRDAAENWGELQFSYQPGRERLTVNWARVLSSDGRVISERPVHEQESRAPVAASAPVYTDVMQRRLSLGGVSPGTLVDYSITIETLEPMMPGDFHASWAVTTGSLVRRSRYIVDTPADVQLRIQERNWRWPRPVTVRNGRRTYVWAAADVPAVEGEPFMAGPDTVMVSIELALPLEWSDIARWYVALARDRYQLSPEVEAAVAQAVRGARSLEDSLRAVHRWVAQDFRYVSLSLGMGGYQPRRPAQVLETRYGDCKDKATLFIAVARRMGVRAFPVLLAAEGGADSTMPTPRQFDHMIAAVELPGRPGYTWLDLTADLTPFGEVPPESQGGFAVVVHDDGHAERVVLPATPAAANRSVIRIEGELTPEGRFNGRFTRSATGSRQYALRETFLEPMSSEDRARFVRSLAQAIFSEGVGDSLEAFEGRDLTATPRLSLTIRDARAVNSAGGVEILQLPIENMASPNLVRELSARGPRRFPISVDAIVGPFEFETELVLTLPAGWRARLPQGVSASSVFGSYRSEYVQEGRQVRVRRYLAGSRGVQPPDRIQELIDWVREVSRDDVRYLVLERP
ncbi:MAG TPA: DUF3857 domain-containing protein [Gemmatimonadales bacterium]|nr:DUF3857 domain-containing protein [Gemmatimonadales bacterium]